jgi:hypothetical protein
MKEEALHFKIADFDIRAGYREDDTPSLIISAPSVQEKHTAVTIKIDGHTKLIALRTAINSILT